MEQWQLVWLITRSSRVQVPLPEVRVRDVPPPSWMYLRIEQPGKAAFISRSTRACSAFTRGEKWSITARIERGLGSVLGSVYAVDVWCTVPAKRARDPPCWPWPGWREPVQSGDYRAYHLLTGLR
jgi:hypothetical protein